MFTLAGICDQGFELLTQAWNLKHANYQQQSNST